MCTMPDKTRSFFPGFNDQKVESYLQLSDSKFATLSVATSQPFASRDTARLIFLRREKENLKADLVNLRELLESQLDSQ